MIVALIIFYMIMLCWTWAWIEETESRVYFESILWASLLWPLYWSTRFFRFAIFLLHEDHG